MNTLHLLPIILFLAIWFYLMHRCKHVWIFTGSELTGKGLQSNFACSKCSRCSYSYIFVPNKYIGKEVLRIYQRGKNDYCRVISTEELSEIIEVNAKDSPLMKKLRKDKIHYEKQKSFIIELIQPHG